jgi:DNA-binding MarR family transcriptional regulator
MEILMNENKNNNSLETRQDIIKILMRLFYLRRSFRGKLPRELENIKTSIQGHNLREKIEQVNDKDVFITIGFVLCHRSMPLTMGDVSRILGIPFSTATRTVDWLVENGYVQRLTDPEDRRVVLVGPTEAGKALNQAMNNLILERAEQLLQNFSPEERKEFGRLLGKLVDNLELYSS